MYPSRPSVSIVKDLNISFPAGKSVVFEQKEALAGSDAHEVTVEGEGEGEVRAEDIHLGMERKMRF